MLVGILASFAAFEADLISANQSRARSRAEERLALGSSDRQSGVRSNPRRGRSSYPGATVFGVLLSSNRRAVERAERPDYAGRETLASTDGRERLQT